MNKVSSFGLYDAPIRVAQKEIVPLTQADIEAQLDSGALVMSREEAIASGFINPHDEQDTCILEVLL